MPVSQSSALKSPAQPHFHFSGQTCPYCDQPIPEDKLEEISGRIEARARERLAEETNRLRDQYARERQQAEANAKAELDRARREGASNLEKLKAESVAREVTVREEVKTQAAAEARSQVEAAQREREASEVALREQLSKSNDARLAAEQARAEIADQVETLRAEKAAAIEAVRQEAAAREEVLREEAGRVAAEESRERLAAVEEAKAEAERKWATAEAERRETLASLQSVKESQEELIRGRVEEVREALEKDKATELAAAKEASDADKRQLSEKLEALQRQVDKQRAEELGEGAHVRLEDELKAAFPSDRIERIARGAAGADLIHTVIHVGRECGKIVYESKNSTQWRDDWVPKLIRDQSAAGADVAVLATFKFPQGGAQVLLRDSVIIVNPARAVMIAEIVRRHIVAASGLRLSVDGRAKKMAVLFHYITAPRFTHLLSRVESHTDALLKLQEKEVKAHQKHWKTEGLLLQSIHKARADLQNDVDLIVCSDQALSDDLFNGSQAEDSLDEGDDDET